MGVNLSSVLSSVGSVLGSNASGAQPLAEQIIQQVAVGAAASGFLAALQHPDVKAAMLPFDPLGLAAKPVVPTAAPAAAPTPAPAVKTIPVATWVALPVESQKAMLAEGYTPA